MQIFFVLCISRFFCIYYTLYFINLWNFLMRFTSHTKKCCFGMFKLCFNRFFNELWRGICKRVPITALFYNSSKLPIFMFLSVFKSSQLLCFCLLFFLETVVMQFPSWPEINLINMLTPSFYLHKCSGAHLLFHQHLNAELH